MFSTPIQPAQASALSTAPAVIVGWMDLRHWIWGRRRRDHIKTIQFKLYSLLFMLHSSTPGEHSQIPGLLRVSYCIQLVPKRAKTFERIPRKQAHAYTLYMWSSMQQVLNSLWYLKGIYHTRQNVPKSIITSATLSTKSAVYPYYERGHFP